MEFVNTADEIFICALCALSAGQAAEIVGISKRAFIEILGHYRVSAFGVSITDLNSDIANA